MNSIPLHNRRINKFISVLVHILNNNDYSHIISWSKDGTTIDIYNSEELKSIILFKYFKYTNLSNFIRQLNLYSFKKVISKDNNIVSYYNPLFCKEASSDNLSAMIRNKVTKKTANILNEKYSSIDSIEDKIKETEFIINEEKDNQEKLLCMKRAFIVESKDSYQYIKDLEHFIYHTLKAPCKNDYKRRIHKSFELRLSKQLATLASKDPIPSVFPIQKICSNDKLTQFLQNDFDSNINIEFPENLFFDKYEENSFGIMASSEGLLNLSTENNLDNPFLSFNFNQNVTTRFKDNEDSYFLGECSAD